MPFLEDVEEARWQISVINTEQMSEDIDAGMCKIITWIMMKIICDEIQQDFEVQHPGFTLNDILSIPL